MELRPIANIDEGVQRELVAEVLAGEAGWRPGLEDAAHRRAENLAIAHAQVREAAGRRGGVLGRVEAKPQLPPDVLGIYVYVPKLAL